MLRDKLTELSEAANRAFLDDDLENALELYDQAIQLCPANHVLHSNRSATLLRLERFRESLDEAEQSILINPKWPKGYLRKGDALRGAKRIEESILAYCQGLAVGGGVEMIAALKDSLRHSLAKERLSVILDEDSGDDLEELRLDPFLLISIIGQEYLNSGFTAQATALLNLALEMDTADCKSVELKLSVFGALSFAYCQQKNYPKAIKYLEVQLDICRQLGELGKQLVIHSSIAKIAVLNDEITLATVHLEKQIEIMLAKGEDASDIRIHLCDLYIQLGRYQCAAQQLAAVGSNSFKSILGVVKLALAKNDTVVALNYCKRLKKASGNAMERAMATVLKCKCLLLRKETTMALNILRSAVARFETDEPSPEVVGQYFGILSECHLAVGQYCTARKWARKELKIATSTGSVELEADSLRNLSNIYQAVEDYPNAVILWYKYCSVIADRSIETRLSSLQLLANLYQKCGRFVEAEASLLQRLLLARKIGCHALVIDAHADMYQFYRALRNEEKSKEHWELAHKIFTEMDVVEREALIVEMSGDRCFDAGSLEEAIEAYDRCLMIVQEDGDLQKEARLCAKLGASHWSLYHADEALAYYQQSLAVCQQTSDLDSMLELYQAMANIHFRKGAMEECHSCLRCYLTLAGFLSKNVARLEAFISIGRTLLLRGRYKEAKKIFMKAFYLTTEKDRRRERGLIHGYIAECYLGLGDKAKASLNFCKQIPFFDDIDDIDGKCETLRHLIEEKQLTKDADWAMRLCKSRVNLSRLGSIDLQVEVLEESAEVAASLSHPQDAYKFLEKAVVLCVTNKYGNILALLLKLKNKYVKCGMKKKAVMLLRKYLVVVADFGQRVTMLFELGKLELQEGLVSNAIAHIVEAREACQDKNLKALCEYALACAFYAKKRYKDALYHMQNVNNLRSSQLASSNDRLELELALIEWQCNASDQAIQAVQHIASKNNSLIIHKFLDESCLYDLLNHDKLSRIAAIHWTMTRGDFVTARHLFNLHRDIYHNSLEYAADLALLYWHDQKFIESAEFLETYLGQCSEKDSDTWSDELSLIQFHSRQQALLDFLYVMLILSKYVVSADAVETVAVAESKFWRDIRNREQSMQYCIPSLQSTSECIKTLNSSLLYCLPVDHYKLLWHFKSGHAAKFCYLDSATTNELPLFYSQFLDQMLATGAITALDSEEFGLLINNSDLLVNVKWGVGTEKIHLTALHEKKYECSQKIPQIGILCAGVNFADTSWEHVSCSDDIDFICKAQVCSVVIIDFTKFAIDFDNILQYKMDIDVAILINSRRDELAGDFRLIGTRCVLDIKLHSFHLLVPFFEKLITGCTVEECLELLQMRDVRLFGDRGSKVRLGTAQLTRKALVNAHKHGLSSDWISEKDQKTLESFEGLPLKMQAYLLDMMSAPKTEEILISVEKLEDLYEQQGKGQVLSECSADDLQQVFVQLAHDEQLATLQFAKRVFADHLYCTCDDGSSIELCSDLDELMKSLVTKIRATRKKQRRRKFRTRGFHSEGENSRRSSLSENTDSEAVVVDVEFRDSE